MEQIELNFAIANSGGMHSSAASSPAALLRGAGVEPDDLCQILGVAQLDEVFPHPNSQTSLFFFITLQPRVE